MIEKKKNIEHGKVGFPYGGRVWGSKSFKNQSWGDQKDNHFTKIFGSIFGAIWCHLGPILSPQTLPKQSQVCFKIDQNWSMNRRHHQICKLCIL